MAYWLIKSEPNVWSWDQQVAKGNEGEAWTGVKNYLARNNMRAMKLGDKAFFYHSNIGKEIVGIVEVCQEIFPDPTDEKWECVKFRAVEKLKRPYTLEEAKNNPKLSNMALVKLTRLSVQPVTEDEWEEVLKQVEIKN
jgi:predicted RNA-binding protein with PUA-like domain